MALATWLGGPEAVYLVVPVLGALTVALTFRLGVMLAGPRAGVLAARLVPSVPLEGWEETRFREGFERGSELGRLDWPPVLEIRSSLRVRVYDPRDRAR